MCPKKLSVMEKIIKGKGRKNKIHRNVGDILANMFQNLTLAPVRVKELAHEFVSVYVFRNRNMSPPHPHQNDVKNVKEYGHILQGDWSIRTP